MPHTPGDRDRPRNYARRPLRIAIVDDHPIVRKGLTELIDHEPGMSVCSASDTLEGGMEAIARADPDVAIVDLTLGPQNGLDLVRALSMSAPTVRILILSMHDELLHAERALRAGAHGYVMKDQAVRQLLDAIRSVAGGKIYVSQAVSERILARAGKAGAAGVAPTEKLTDREREVLALVGRGLTTRAIARQLNLSVKTIETYKARLKDKLGFESGHELLRAAIEWARN